MLREAEPIFHALKKLKSNYDVLLIDGHGLLHPRRCGLACYVGVALGRPTIGVAKSLLCGTVKSDGHVELGGEILGYVLGKSYISTGHKVSLDSAVAIVKQFTKSGIPEPLKLADANSKLQKRKRGLGFDGDWPLFCFFKLRFWQRVLYFSPLLLLVVHVVAHWQNNGRHAR